MLLKWGIRGVESTSCSSSVRGFRRLAGGAITAAIIPSAASFVPGAASLVDCAASLVHSAATLTREIFASAGLVCIVVSRRCTFVIQVHTLSCCS